MGLVYEDECVDCQTFCMNCGRKHVPHYYCDECGDEGDLDELYAFEGWDDVKMLCRYCLCGKFKTIEQYGIEKF